MERLGDSIIKDTIIKNRQMYNVGTQGPDVFFYYLACLYRRSWYQLGSTMHKTKVQAFFSAMADCINELESGPEKDIVASYLAGYLTHYALDYNTHPYIYYRSGFKTDGDRKRKLQHSVNHRNFETNIDIMMLKLISAEKPSDRKIWELIKVSRKESKVTAQILSKVLNQVYGVRMNDRQVYQAIYSMFMANRIMQSKNGNRKYIMEFIENFTVGEHVVSSLIHEQEAKGGIDFLNLKKSPWYMPWDNKEEHKVAFTDMFERSVMEADVMIHAEYDFLKGEISKDEFLKAIGNYSLSTGVDSDLVMEFKFSDVVY